MRQVGLGVILMLLFRKKERLHFPHSIHFNPFLGTIPDQVSLKALILEQGTNDLKKNQPSPSAKRGK